MIMVSIDVQVNYQFAGSQNLAAENLSFRRSSGRKKRHRTNLFGAKPAGGANERVVPGHLFERSVVSLMKVTINRPGRTR
ncbi:hypothetical protein BH09PLA1_BH09PLA1_27340 [soil metagenome]